MGIRYHHRHIELDRSNAMLLKKLWFSLILLCGSTVAHASLFAYVQSRGTTGGSTAVALAYSSNVAAGDILTALGYSYNTSCMTAVTDTISSTWTLAAPVISQNGAVMCLWTAIAPSSGANTVTASGFGGGDCCGLIIGEYSTSVPNFTTLVLSHVHGGSAPNTVTSSSPGQADEYLAIFIYGNGQGNYSITCNPAALRQSVSGISGAETVAQCDKDVTGSPLLNSATNTFTGGSGTDVSAVFLIIPTHSGGGGGGSATNSGYAN